MVSHSTEHKVGVSQSATPQVWFSVFPHSHTQLLPSKILLCSFPSNATSLLFLFKIRCIPYLGYFSFPVLVFSCPMRVLQTNLGPLQEQYVLILLNCASSSVLLSYLLYIPNILPISFPFIVADFNIWDKIYSICFCEISLFQLTRQCINFPANDISLVLFTDI